MGWMNIPKLYHNKTLLNYIGNEIQVQQGKDAIQENRGVFLTGGCGSGKTHLAIGLMVMYSHNHRELSPKNHPKFLPAVELFLELKSTFNSSGTEKEVLDKYSQTNILCIDDIGAEKISDWTRQSFYTLIDRRYRDAKQTILTSNFELDKIATNIDDRISSRIVEMCEIIKLSGNDYRIKKGK